MARRKSHRRFSVPVASSSGERLPGWVVRGIERGRLTEEKYRQGVEDHRQRERAELIRRVPPLVAAAGPRAVDAWADEWLEVDGRLVRGHGRDGSPDPRAPLTYAEAAQR